MPEFLELLGAEELSREAEVVLLVVAVLVVGFLIQVSVRKLAKKVSETATEVDDKILDVVRNFYKFVLAFIAIVGGLKIYDVDVSPLLAGAGVVGLVVGLALKETLANVLAGVAILIDRPFAEHDRIQLKKPSGHWGGWGNVKEIGLRRTKVENTDGVVINYPNSELANSTIINFSDKNQRGGGGPQPIRVRVRYCVAWSADIDKAIEVSKAAIWRGVDKASTMDPPLKVSRMDVIMKTMPAVLVRSIWDDSQGLRAPGVVLEGRYFLDDVRDRTKVRSIVLIEVLKALRENDIPLPRAESLLEGLSVD